MRGLVQRVMYLRVGSSKYSVRRLASSEGLSAARRAMPTRGITGPVSPFVRLKVKWEFSAGECTNGHGYNIDGGGATDAGCGRGDPTANLFGSRAEGDDRRGPRETVSGGDQVSESSGTAECGEASRRFYVSIDGGRGGKFEVPNWYLKGGERGKTQFAVRVY